MKSKARRIIERWVRYKKDTDPPWDKVAPTYLSPGQVFLWPSYSDETTHYLVVWLRRVLPSGTQVNEFACGCKGFYYNPDDNCRHILALKAQLEQGARKLGMSPDERASFGWNWRG